VNEGAVSASGNVMGTYLHGVFASDEFRRAFLKNLGAKTAQKLEYDRRIDQILDEFAAHLESHCDLDEIARHMKSVGV
jgi:adenosylcobyric acid synthase